MLDIYAGDYNLGNPIEDKLPMLIEYFTQFYGEEHRESITQKINDTTFFFLPSKDGKALSDTNNSFEQMKKNLTRQLIESVNPDYNKNVEIDFNPQNLDSLIQSINNKSLTETQKQELNNIKHIFNIKNKLFSSSIKQMQELLGNLNNNFKQNFVDDFESISLDQDDALTYFEAFKDAEKIQESFDKKYDNLICQYFAKVKNCDIEKIKSNKNIQQYITTYKNILEAGQGKWGFYFLDANLLKQRKIELFNFLGFNLGKDINTYFNNHDLHRKVFDLKLNIAINTLKFDKKEAIDKNTFQNEFFMDAYQTVKSLNANSFEKNQIVKNVFDFVFNPSSTNAFVTRYFDNVDNRVKSICVFPFGSSLNDNILIHELGHIVQGETLKKTDDYFIVKSGISKVFYFLNKYYDASKTPEYQEIYNSKTTALNEICNEKLAVELTQKIKQDGNEICLKKDYQNSDYCYLFGVLDDFFKNNIDNIKTSMINKNINPESKFKNFDKIVSLTDTFLNKVLSSKDYFLAMNEIGFSIGTESLLQASYNCKDYLNKKWSEPAQKIIDYYKKAKELSTSNVQENSIDIG